MLRNTLMMSAAAGALGFGTMEGAPSMPANVGAADHYVMATVDTVRWGIYDIDKSPVMEMKSGETVTIEVATHHGGHDYEKMIKGDPALEAIYAWSKGQSLMSKAVEKTPGSGVHIITGPVNVEGAMPGDVVQVEILALAPRLNPATGKCYGTNSQKFAGYQFRVGHADGTAYSRDGGHEYITVFEFVETPGGKMAWAKPISMYMFPTIMDPGGTTRTFDGMPGIIIPHATDVGGTGFPISYPEDLGAGTTLISDGRGNPGVIYYPDVDLDWKVPLRPHLGTLAVMPANTKNYENGKPGVKGANSIPPSKFGGNVDNWRIGKGTTMYYTCETVGCGIMVGDTHAAQGDSELAGTAMETSMTVTLKIDLHKKNALPDMVKDLTYPLMETDDNFVISGFAFTDYLDQLENPSTVFAAGASVDLALENAFNNTRAFIMKTYDTSEPETIALMATGVDFGITQIVDGNWGVHAIVPKWIFESPDTPYDYSCSFNNPSGTTGAFPGSYPAGPGRKMMETHNINEEAHTAKLAQNVRALSADATVSSMHAKAIGRRMLEAKFNLVDKHANPLMGTRIAKALKAATVSK
jgi:acetamidase/formamidase